MAQSNAIGADLRAEGVAIAKLGGTVLDSTDIGAYAVELRLLGPRHRRVHDVVLFVAADVHDLSPVAALAGSP